MSTVESRLKALGITIPALPMPAGKYVPWVRSGNLVFVSGQVSRQADGTAVTGKLGGAVSLEQGQAAARICAINLLAAIKDACGGDLERVTRVVRLGGFVNAVPEFTQHPQVINGASELIGEVFGDKGKHARAAVGCSSLPMDVSVEIEAVFEVA